MKSKKYKEEYQGYIEEPRYYSGTAEELLNDPYELRLYMTKMDREHKAEVEELKGDLCSSEAGVEEYRAVASLLKTEVKQLKEQLKESKAETKSWKNAAKQGYTII